MPVTNRDNFVKPAPHPNNTHDVIAAVLKKMQTCEQCGADLKEVGLTYSRTEWPNFSVDVDRMITDHMLSRDLTAIDDEDLPSYRLIAYDPETRSSSDWDNSEVTCGACGCEIEWNDSTSL